MGHNGLNIMSLEFTTGKAFVVSALSFVTSFFIAEDMLRIIALIVTIAAGLAGLVKDYDKYMTKFRYWWKKLFNKDENSTKK